MLNIQVDCQSANNGQEAYYMLINQFPFAKKELISSDVLEDICFHYHKQDGLLLFFGVNEMGNLVYCPHFPRPYEIYSYSVTIFFRY